MILEMYSWPIANLLCKIWNRYGLVNTWRLEEYNSNIREYDYKKSMQYISSIS